MIAGAHKTNSRVWVTAFLGLGSNQGDRLDHLRRAVFALATHPEITVQEISGIYETQYVGEGQQDPYLNACVCVQTRLSPEVLLVVLKSAEQRHGRQPDSHMMPRPLDLDILLYGDEIRNENLLTLPHPRLLERSFVLEPLSEIAPTKKIPNSGETVVSACAKIRQKSKTWLRKCSEMNLLPEKISASKEDWRAALAVHCY